MSRKVIAFLAISIGWSALVGAGLFFTRTALDSVVGIAALAVLYMPSPFVAAVIVERGIRRDRFRVPRRTARQILGFLLAPIAAILAFTLLYLSVVFVAGNLLRLPLFGAVALTPTEIMAGAAALLGQAAVDAAGPPPPVLVLLLVAIWGAIVAGWTVNGLVAMGEEYGWRGLLWDEVKPLGPVRANLLIGVAWGLWHAPLILQGYNFAGHPFAGIVAMVLFCIGISFALTALRERTGSVIPVAAAHGMFNGLAAILLLIVPGTPALLTGPLGLVGAVLFAIIGVGLSVGVTRRSRAPLGAALSGHDRSQPVDPNPTLTGHSGT